MVANAPAIAEEYFDLDFLGHGSRNLPDIDGDQLFRAKQ